MATFACVCLGVITVELGIIAAFLIAVSVRFGRAARAAEDLTHRVDEEIAHSSSLLRSGLAGAFQALVSAAAGWMGGRRRRSRVD